MQKRLHLQAESARHFCTLHFIKDWLIIMYDFLVALALPPCCLIADVSMLGKTSLNDFRTTRLLAPAGLYGA